MRYSLLPTQKKIFDSQGAIIFEELWDAEQLQVVRGALKTVLAQRLGVAGENVARSTPQQSYIVGRDVWRGSTLLKKAVVSPALADLAAELFDRRPLRLAYDQYLPAWYTVAAHRAAELRHYADLLQRCATLEETSSIQGIVGGVVVCLESPPALEDATLIVTGDRLMPWPKQPGSGVFFRGNTPLDFRLLQTKSESSYLLIAYSRDVSVYIMQPGDPQVHALKHVGYNFGDRLNDKLNPIAVR